ncbi:carbamoyltransferase HypF [Acidimangrovimonas pyrenivorans]|uniref:Carbamoyltransferase HypF n=1 Tax=Acidimangrovimonas pyrenivorans TaxID=2030798 RepID=A0ABV7AKD3_9RHOB
MPQGRAIRVRGQVQGVGFRPFVWQLARRFGLRGEVLNDPEGVLIRAFGDDLDAFATALAAEAPPLARVDAVETAPHRFDSPPDGFTIAPSCGTGAETRVTPDAATCPACLAEIRDPAQRRHGYAFTNCTHCGPRFTILRALPYDRAQTSMAPFGICPACRAEYEDPADRRFHAQPVACPACGPRLWLEIDAAEFPGDPVAEAARRLQAGQILALKGLGGFHLACDARNPAALATLRARKRRPAKPFALMAPLETIRAHANVSDAEATLLADPAAPIVLLPRAGAPLPEAIAPGLPTLGWMLPYTPLHHLLLDAFGGPLVMTSGNLTGEPQAIGNDEARAKLGPFADAFLMHDRDIVRRLDDPVERLLPSGPMILRRARGRVPGTLPLPPGFEDAAEVTAFGGQMKSALCLIRNGQALLSHHLGDLDDALTWEEFIRADADYAELFDHRPTLMACDLHPGYRASAHAAARAGAAGVPLVEVQHHHAHLAAAMGDALWPRDGGPVAGIVLDGLGLGTDGTIWGGELLLGDYRAATRIAHLKPVPLIGGDAANREPWRNLLAQLDAAGLGAEADRLLSGRPLPLLRQAAASGINAPLSSSAGRLFDAVAAALGLAGGAQSYEGEAAIALEGMALEGIATGIAAAPYPFARTGAQIDPAPMWRALIADLAAGRPVPEIAAAFHAGLARAVCAPARRLVEEGEARAVALSGGCFQNATLLALCLQELEGIEVLLHHATPANDGGLALGQALVAAARHPGRAATGRPSRLRQHG